MHGSSPSRIQSTTPWTAVWIASVMIGFSEARNLPPTHPPPRNRRCGGSRRISFLGCQGQRRFSWSLKKVSDTFSGLFGRLFRLLPFFFLLLADDFRFSLFGGRCGDGRLAFDDL